MFFSSPALLHALIVSGEAAACWYSAHVVKAGRLPSSGMMLKPSAAYASAADTVFCSCAACTIGGCCNNFIVLFPFIYVLCVIQSVGQHARIDVSSDC